MYKSQKNDVKQFYLFTFFIFSLFSSTLAHMSYDINILALMDSHSSVVLGEVKTVILE